MDSSVKKEKKRKEKTGKIIFFSSPPSPHKNATSIYN